MNLLNFAQEVWVHLLIREIKIGVYNVRTPGSIQDTDYGTFSVDRSCVQRTIKVNGCY